jgi:hypothetical protein
MHLIQCAEEGADVAPAPFKVIDGLFNHPLTDIGLARFISDYEKVNGKEEATADKKEEQKETALVNGVS